MAKVTETGVSRMKVFAAADAFVVEAFRVARTIKKSEGADLAREIRRTAALSGGAVVAAAARPAGGPGERRSLRAARGGMVEGRYYLYLARRLGLIDLKRYRSVACRQDAAIREVDALLAAPGSGNSNRGAGEAIGPGGAC